MERRGRGACISNASEMMGEKLRKMTCFSQQWGRGVRRGKEVCASAVHHQRWVQTICEEAEQRSERGEGNVSTVWG